MPKKVTTKELLERAKRNEERARLAREEYDKRVMEDNKALIEGLLYLGTYFFVGAPKFGKLFFMLLEGPGLLSLLIIVKETSLWPQSCLETLL